MEFTQVLGNTRAMYTTWNPSRVMEIISDIPIPFRTYVVLRNATICSSIAVAS